MLGRRLGELTEVLLLEVEGSEAGLLATLAVVQVVVIKAQPVSYTHLTLPTKA